MLSVESAPRSNGKHVSFAIDGHGSSVENNVYTEKLIDLNQDILRTVGVSHSTIDKVCETTMTYGFHSKLTGAGGGGCVITLLKQDVKSETVDKLSKELKELGCDCWRTKLGGEGVAVHNWTSR